MAIVNNPHNIQDIDKQYKTWVKLTKPKGFVYRYNLLSMTSNYLANNWWPATTEGNIDKATPLKQKMFRDIKTTYFDTNPDINDGSFTNLFYKNDDKEYTFSIHFFTPDELSKPDNRDKNILTNDALFEIRLFDKNDPSGNALDSLRINCELSTNNGLRSNLPNRNILPEKFVIGCYNPITKESIMIQSDETYQLDGMLYLSVYGLTGDFVNIFDNPTNFNSITPNLISLASDDKVDERDSVISTDSIKIPKVTEGYFFTDATKQRNALAIPRPIGFNTGDQDYLVQEMFTKNYTHLKDFTLFTKFKLNTEFMNMIVGPYYFLINDYGGRYDKKLITNIDMNSIRFDNCKKVIGLFSKLQGLKTISNFKFNGGNKIESINHMFAGCESMENIDISSWDLPSSCKNLNRFFDITPYFYRIYSFYSSNVKTITLPIDFERRVSNVETFEEVFSFNTRLTTVNNLSLNMPKCKSFAYLFNNCRTLKNVNLANITTIDSEPANLEFMFNNCSELTGIIDLTRVRYIKSINQAFVGTQKISTIKFSPGALNTASNSYDKKMDKNSLISAFYSTNATAIEHLEDLDAPEIESLEGTFSGLINMQTINLPNFKMEGVKSLDSTFRFNYYKLRSINIPKVEKLNPDLTTIKEMFNASRVLETLDFPPLTKPNNPQNTKKLKTLESLFNGCANFKTTIYINNLDTSNVENLSYAFAFFNTTTGADLIGVEDINTSNVKYFNSTFTGKYKNKAVMDLRKWDVRKGVNFYSIFNMMNCDIDITGWDVSNLVYGRGFFSGMHINNFDQIKGLETLNFSSLKSGNACNNESSNTSTPEYIMSEFGGIDSMFSGMVNIITFTMPNCLKTLPNITSLYELFQTCYKVQTVDFAGCQYGVIGNIGRLCSICYELRTIDLTALNLNIRCGAYAFKECRNLREIKGTLVFDERITEDQSKYLLKNMFINCNSLSNVKVKNIPGNNKALFESVTGIRSNQYTVVS